MKKDTLLFATGEPELSTSLKSYLHVYDFLDQEVLVKETLTWAVAQCKPSVVVLTEILENRVEVVLELCKDYLTTQFILMGDIFLHDATMQTLPNAKLLASSIKDPDGAFGSINS